MRKSIGRQALPAAVALLMILGFNCIQAAYLSAAESNETAFNLSASMADNLSMLKGKTVTVYLVSGQTLTGTVNDVKNNLLHLGKLSQKDFFDALVEIDRISAIDTRVRGQ